MLIRERDTIPDPQHWNNSWDDHKNSDSYPNSVFFWWIWSKLQAMVRNKTSAFYDRKFQHIYSQASMKCFQSLEETSRSPWRTSSSSTMNLYFIFVDDFHSPGSGFRFRIHGPNWVLIQESGSETLHENESLSSVYKRYRVLAGTGKPGFQFYCSFSPHHILISSKIVPLVFSLCQQALFEFIYIVED